MTTDTSREAVQDLIAEAQVITGNPFPPMSNRDATLTGRMQDTLAALLDERDGALAGATTLPHEAAMAGTAGEFAARWNSYRPEKREQAWAGIRAGLDRGNACFTGMHDSRIRDLEAEVVERDRMQVTLVKRIRHLEVTNRKISERSANHHDNAIKWRDRAERAEAERDRLQAAYNKRGDDLVIAYTQRDIARAERDKLTAELADETKRADENFDDVHKWRSEARKLAAKLDAVRVAVRNHLNISADDILAILADTDEPKDSITFNTDDLGPATDIDGNPLADTDEGGVPLTYRLCTWAEWHAAQILEVANGRRP